MKSSFMTNTLLMLAVLCVMSASVTCRLHARDFEVEKTPERIEEDYYENVVSEDKTNLFKYIVDAYYKIANENSRLKEKYLELSAFVKFITEGN